MNKLELREASLGECLFASIVYVVWLVFSISVICYFCGFSEQDPSSRFPVIMLVLLLSPFMVLSLSGLKNVIISYHTKLAITEEEITLYRGRNVRRVSLSQVSDYGCAGFVARSNYLFFCTVPRKEIEDYAAKNIDQAWDLFGPDRVQRMITTEFGAWQLKLGIYLHDAAKDKTQTRTLIFRDGRPEALHAVSSYFKSDPVLTGPILVDNPRAWTKHK